MDGLLLLDSWADGGLLRWLPVALDVCCSLPLIPISTFFNAMKATPGVLLRFIPCQIRWPLRYDQFLVGWQPQRKNSDTNSSAKAINTSTKGGSRRDTKYIIIHSQHNKRNDMVGFKPRTIFYKDEPWIVKQIKRYWVQFFEELFNEMLHSHHVEGTETIQEPVHELQDRYLYVLGSGEIKGPLKTRKFRIWVEYLRSY